jgi:hypothetical protein
MTDLEQLSSVLHSEAAAVAVPPHAWEVNVRRVRRARRRKGVLASVMVVGTVVAGAAAFDLARADGGPTQRIAAGDEPTGR